MADRKALFLRNMPTELVRDAKAAAARRGETLTAIVAEALSRSLRVEDDARSQNHVLDRDIAWFQANQPKLLRRYSGEFVAIVDEAVVDHARDFGVLAERVFARFGTRDIYMPRVEGGERTSRIRSPRRSTS